MNPSLICLWMCVFVLFFIVIPQQNREKEIIRKIIQRKRSKGEREEMKALAERFIDKECIISMYNGTQNVGTIKEISDSAMLIADNEGNEKAINIDFVMEIREHPKNKRGKKKSVVID